MPWRSWLLQVVAIQSAINVPKVIARVLSRLSFMVALTAHPVLAEKLVDSTAHRRQVPYRLVANCYVDPQV